MDTLAAITQWDFSLLDALQGCRTPFFDKFFSLITHLGDHGLFCIALALVLLCIPRTRRLGLCVAIALLLDLLLVNIIIKPLVDRPRPYELQPFELLISAPRESSFPSGHAAAAFAAVTALTLNRSKLAIPMGILAAIISFSRLYLYVHYPTDVFAGILTGILCGLLAWLLCRWILSKKHIFK